jgi:Ca-activated chloride channel family protein
MVMAARDDAALRALADAGGGVYVAMRDDHADIDALHGLLRNEGHPLLATDQQGDDWQDRGPWLLLPLLPLVALSFRRGWLALLPLVLLPCLPNAAHASAWSDLWQRPDQQADAALRAGHAKQAQQLARDPALRGAAAYRAGDYAAAAEALRQVPGSDAAYNLGNALARRGDYQGALEAYDRVLKADPANADARANHKAVEDWLHRQQQQNGGAQNDPSKGGQGASSTPPDNAQGKQGQQGDKDAQQKQEEGKPSADAHGDNQGAGNRQQASPSPADKNEASAGTQPKTPEQQAAERAREAQAQQALQKEMDQALGKSSSSRAPARHDLGAIQTDDAQARLPAEVRQALQRVPDDPGALLRRKFDLEYRQRHGGVSAEDDSP